MLFSKGATDMANRGRPRVIDGDVRDLLTGLVGMGCSFKQAAEHVGIGPSTLFKTLREDEDFAAQLRRARMQQDLARGRRPGSWSGRIPIATHAARR
jgi:hypothetical protein